MARGFVYLTTVVDVASRRVLAHRLANTLDAVFPANLTQVDRWSKA
jgi:putative transposase